MDDFYRGIYPDLFRYARYLTGDPELAQDLCQEALIRWHQLDAKAGIKYPLAWLKKVIHHLALNQFRHNQVKQRLEISGPTQEKMGVTFDLTRLEVEDILSNLPWRDQMLLKMRMADMSYKDIAAAMEVSVGSVGTMMARAMRRFRIAYTGEEANHGDVMSRGRADAALPGR